jgi:hypothetical protein
MRKRRRKPIAETTASKKPRKTVRRWGALLAACAAALLVIYAVYPAKHGPSTFPGGRPAPPPPGPMPWEATRENTPAVDEHHIPAWKVPTPRPTAWNPRPPSPPPDPIGNRPPTENPGGVNGARPPRERPELMGATATPPPGLVPEDRMVSPDPAALAAPQTGAPTERPVAGSRFGPSRGFRRGASPRP